LIINLKTAKVHDRAGWRDRIKFISAFTVLRKRLARTLDVVRPLASGAPVAR
jgi:hypothetical protein